MLLTAAAAAVLVATAATPAAAPKTKPKPKPPVTITGASVQGRVAKVRVRIRGWRTGARFRIFVDGRYNNFSTNPTTGLALNLTGGTHLLTADLLLSGRHSLRSLPRRITVARNSDPVLAAAGDMACDPADPAYNGGRGTATRCHAAATAALVAGARPNLVLPLGDEQYECGGTSAWSSYSLSWGKFNAISRPVPGNHEYGSEGAVPFTPTCDSPSPGAAYFSYFGAISAPPNGYYSYDVAGWHVIAVNSECGFIGGCDPGTSEDQWLRTDLAAHPTQCTLVYWHHPRWSGTAPGAGDTDLDALWRDVYAGGVELVLSGHRHVYSSMPPLNGDGALDPAAGVRQITVGTGGHSLFQQAWADFVTAHNTTEYGILLLTLHPSSYEWQFEPEQGGLFTDYGTGTCH